MAVWLNRLGVRLTVAAVLCGSTGVMLALDVSPLVATAVSVSVVVVALLVWWVKHADADLTLLATFSAHGGNALPAHDSPAVIERYGGGDCKVWITGATSGFGEQLALRFARLGANVILTARREEELKRVRLDCLTAAAEAGHEGLEVLVLPGDLAKLKTLPALAQAALAWRDAPVSVLINNAGLSTRCLGTEVGFEVDEMVMRVNHFAPVILTKAVLPTMPDDGHIVNVSSVAGKLGSPLRTSYSASKFAIIGFMDALRAEFRAEGVGIAVTNICPGPVHTNVGASALTVGGRKYGHNFDKADARVMELPRAVDLVMAAIWHRLDEVWISRQPVLLATYLSQYAPTLARRVMVKATRDLIAEHRAHGKAAN